MDLNDEQNLKAKRLYGKTPTRRDLLHHQLDERKYFDSGDFALSQAREPSNIGAVKTGIHHPHREKISAPSCPVPDSSNVNTDQPVEVKRQGSMVKHESHLHGKTDSEKGARQDGLEKTSG
ncbi:hypothetical protein G7046_g2128 [Stylonectria norvegica]|nr:hypothetical protein G7046_g2128 [Stylonectria norvegica]